ncbi:MAG TPA: hypothetical protein DEP92_01500, partial [Candidatus Komeilibacteria bacterium]|nr:hypothetical protein [Candidatus Komeilibacteria bacterium]
ASVDALSVIDISNPAAPTLVAQEYGPIPHTSLNWPRSVFVAGNYAYIADYSRDALIIMDVSDPTDPVYITEVRPGGDNGNLNGANSVFVKGNYAYVTAEESDTFAVIDVSGLTVSNADIGNLNVTNLTVEANAMFAQGVRIQGGFNVSQESLFNDALAINSATSTSVGISLLKVTATSSVDLVQFAQMGTGK